MSAHTHTPGPWTIGAGIRHADTIGINKHRPSDDPEIGEWIETIAEVLPGQNGVAEADARLIAAAPELLAVAEWFLEYCAQPEQKWIDALRATIAKAKGEAK